MALASGGRRRDGCGPHEQRRTTPGSGPRGVARVRAGGCDCRAVSTLRHHARNTAGLLFSAVVAKVLFLLATVRCFKALSVEANGNLQLAYIVGTTVMILSEVGLREIGRASCRERV